MKNNLLRIAALLLVVSGLVTLEACKKSHEDPALSLVTLTANDVDLNGTTAPTNVATSAVIIASFTTNIDESTATNANITLTRDYDNSDVAKTILVAGNIVTITPTAELYSGDHYVLAFTSGLKSTAGKAITADSRSFGTAGIGLGTAPQSSSQVMYIQFENSILDLTGNATASFEQVAYTTDRFGVANAAASFRGATANGNGDIVELTGSHFINPSTTFSVWFKVNTADYEGSRTMFGLASLNGFFFEVGSGGVDWFKFATDHAIAPGGDPVHFFATGWTDYINGGSPVDGQLLFNRLSPISDLVADNGWHQMTMTYDATTSLKTFFIDGVKIMQADIDLNTTEWAMKDFALNTKGDDGNAPAPTIDTKMALGYGASRANTNPDWMMYSTSQNTFKGAMDDFRIFNKALTESEVTALFNAEKAN